MPREDSFVTDDGEHLHGQQGRWNRSLFEALFLRLMEYRVRWPYNPWVMDGYHLICQVAKLLWIASLA